LALSGSVFEFDGTLARLHLDDCVVAPAGNALPTLVAIDNARNLTWRGRSNLYGKLRAYLESTGKAEGTEAIIDFARWKDAGPEIEEIGSTAVARPVWSSPQPLRDLVIEQENPTQAFELAPAYAQLMTFGVRQGPFGARLDETARQPERTTDGGTLVAAADASGKHSAKSTMPKETEPIASRSSSDQPAEAPQAAGSGTRTSGLNLSFDEDPSSLPAMPPMTNPSATDLVTPAANEPRPDPARAVTAEGDPPFKKSAAAPVEKVPAAMAEPVQSGDSEEDLIRSTEQFMNYLNRLGAKGGVLRLAREADLELPALDLPALSETAGSGQWQIEGERGPGRPRLRFHPSRFTARPPTAWSALFNLRRGTLSLHGVDIMVQVRDDEAPDAGRLAAFGLGAGTDLTLSNCTITITSRSPNSAAIGIQPLPSGEKAPEDPAAAAGALVRLEDSFLRSAGEGVAVAANRLLDLHFRNVAIATDGSLLHAVGSPRIDRSKTSLKIKLDRVVARTKGGLAYLESSQDDADLPLTEIQAVSSIFSTGSQAALFRVDGQQGQMDRSRDRIVWKAEKVAYDQITTYRRDQVLQTGVSPRDYSRADWRTAFDPKDEAPVIESVRFFKTPERWRSACSLTEIDFRLDSQSPALGRGPDLNSIPSPPPSEM
jgi:hypothetical protein